MTGASFSLLSQPNFWKWLLHIFSPPTGTVFDIVIGFFVYFLGRCILVGQYSVCTIGWHMDGASIHLIPLTLVTYCHDSRVVCENEARWLLPSGKRDSYLIQNLQQYWCIEQLWIGRVCHDWWNYDCDVIKNICPVGGRDGCSYITVHSWWCSLYICGYKSNILITLCLWLEGIVWDKCMKTMKYSPLAECSEQVQMSVLAAVALTHWQWASSYFISAPPHTHTHTTSHTHTHY